MHTRLLVAYSTGCLTMYSKLYDLRMDTGSVVRKRNIYMLVS